jgi:hypothetical protein
VTGPDGFLQAADPEQGFFVGGARFLTTWKWSAGGASLEHVVDSAVAPDRWMGYYLAASRAGTGGAHGTVEVAISRALSPNGMSEEVALTSYAPRETRFTLELEVRGDLGDRQGARTKAVRGGWRKHVWRDRGGGAWELTIALDAGRSPVAPWAPSERTLRVRFDARGCSIVPARGRLRVRVRLGWHERASVVSTLTADAEGLPASSLYRERAGACALSAPAALEGSATAALGPVVIDAFGRARDDLAAAGTAALDTGGIQAAMLGAEPLRGALDARIHRWRSGDDRWRETSPALFALSLAELWAWTGDRALVSRLLDLALAGLRWMDDRCDPDRDGLYECEVGVRHGEDLAIVDENGREAEPPVAPCEAQGYAFLAKVRLSQILAHFGRSAEARRLACEAAALQKRFVDGFWQEDIGFFAIGLDAAKAPIRTIASGPGHCLATGIIPRSVSGRTAARLLRPDMFSGWGVRTLSADHPVYSPYGYRSGCVWVVEQGTFALGMALAGLHEDAERLARGFFDAVSIFAHHRLPQAMSGHPRDSTHPFPAVHPRSSPRASSASAVVATVRALLGLVPSAATGRLFVDPRLPSWLPALTLRGLHVGPAEVDLRFVRQPNGAVDVHVVELRGRVEVVRRQPLHGGDASTRASLPAR